MTQTPSDGWMDGRGGMHPGYPPPGFWQATDGRWYPPETAPMQQQPPPGMQYTQPQDAIAPAPKKNRTGLWVALGILGFLVLALGGCSVLLIAGTASVANDINEQIAAENEDSADEPDLSDSQDTADNQDTAGQGSGLEIVGGDETADVGPCTIVDAETMQFEVTNNSPNISSYFLTVAFFDDGGQRTGDTFEALNHLRAGEKSIETYFLFDPATTCEIIEVERFASESDAGEVAEVSACEITGVDFAGDIEGTISATNGSPETSDYNITVAIVDPDGIRRGTGFTFIEAVRSGETAPSDVFTFVEAADGYRCEVVAVDRTASS